MALDKIEAKIREFSAAEEAAGAGLSAAESAALASLCATLAATSRWHASAVTRPEAALPLALLGRWPAARAFPVLDLLRVAALHAAGAEALAGSFLLDGPLPQALAAAAAAPDQMALGLVGLRLAANLFAQPVLRVQVGVRERWPLALGRGGGRRGTLATSF